jgi:hypothetical protein
MLPTSETSISQGHNSRSEVHIISQSNRIVEHSTFLGALFEKLAGKIA